MKFTSDYVRAGDKRQSCLYRAPYSGVMQEDLRGYVRVRLARTIYIQCTYGSLARKLPNVWSYTACIYSSGQPYI
jgi:hypothetical protein